MDWHPTERRRLFLGNTAYVSVTSVSPYAGGTDIDGIDRVDGPDKFTVVAKLRRWSVAHPPTSSFFGLSGVQYALEIYRGRFLVTDGHHNRLLRVTVDRCLSSPSDDESNVTELIAFDNDVPTGLAVSGHTVYLAEPARSCTCRRAAKSWNLISSRRYPVEVASGARLLVDVETGPRHQSNALSQGIWSGGEAGDSALPNTGSLVKFEGDGGFTAWTARPRSSSSGILHTSIRSPEKCGNLERLLPSPPSLALDQAPHFARTLMSILLNVRTGMLRFRCAAISMLSVGQRLESVFFYFTGISTGALLSLTRNTTNFAGLLLLAFRPTV